MAYDNAQMAAALGALLSLDPAEIATLADDLDQWALGGARLATWSRLATDVTLFNNAAVAMVHDWYGGTANGGPNGDGTYPLMNSEGEMFMVPSPARLQSDMTSFDPRGSVGTVMQLPATGETGDLWVVTSTGDAWGWSSRQQGWRNLGRFQGPIGATGAKGDTGSQGPKGDTGATGAKGDTGAQGPQGNVGPKGDTGAQGPKGDTGAQGPQGVEGPQGPKGDTGDTGPQGDQGPQGVKGDRGEAFTVDAQGTLVGRAAYDAEAVGFSYLDDQNGNLYFRIAAGGWSPPIPFGKGDPGDAGPQGPQGPQGVPGPKGDTGAQGPQGVQGVQGAKGDTGAQGPAGSDATVSFATGADLRTATSATKALTPKSVADAAALVGLTDAATIAVDLAAGTNFIVTLAGNRTLGAPSGAKPGMSGTILIKQDATGSRTLAYNTAWKPFGSTPALSTAASAVDLLTWLVEDTGKVRFTLAKGGAA